MSKLFTRQLLAFTLSLSVCGAAIMGCGGSSSNNNNNNPNPGVSGNAGTVVSTYASIVYESYRDTLTTNLALQDSIDVFVASPSAPTLQAAKTAWLAAREVYAQTEAYRFYSGPIDNEVDGPEGLMNSWPLDEQAIDYIQSDANSGVINDLTIPNSELTAQGIADLNQFEGEASVTTGYHAIEFLLWGQDLSDGAGAGQRDFTDYTTATNHERRGLYLKAIAQLLVDNTQQLVDAWAPNNASNYRAAFTAESAQQHSLAKILVGIGSLSGGEMGGERMRGLDTGDKEEEHSCFSDNTHRDFVMDQQGIANVYLGRYVRLNGAVIDGPGINDLVISANQNLNSQVTSQLATTQQLLSLISYRAVGGMPFDQQIKPDNTTEHSTVDAARVSLQAQASLFSQVAQTLNLNINLDQDGQ